MIRRILSRPWQKNRVTKTFEIQNYLLIRLCLDAVEGLKKQFAQLQAKKQSTLQAIEQEDREYEEMIGVNSELREQRDKLTSKLTEMKDKIEILHAEISREGASNHFIFIIISI